MSLQFIYGRAGTGKSTYCLNTVKEYIKKANLDEKYYLIVPEQFSYATEKALLDLIENKSVINAEVISFKRMADRIFNEVGGSTKTYLSKTGKSMLLNNILETTKLEVLGNTDENIDIVLRTITELKKHMITMDMLKESINNTKDVLLKTKLEDIYKIYDAYEKKIHNNFIDEEDVLSHLSKKLDESKMFENSYVFIDEFLGFTVQEYEIIKKIAKTAKKVYLTVCTDKIEENSNPDTDIFYTSKKTIKKLIGIAEEENIKIEEPIKLDKNYRFKNDELKHLEKNIYTSKYEKYQKEVNNIILNFYLNPYEEVENVAKKISSLIKDGVRYRNIAVITNSLDEYSSIAKVVFEKYNIPVFIDEKILLSKKIIIKYVLSILDVFAKNWSNDAIWSYIKSGFLDISKDDIYELENYCKKWGIKKNKWYKEDFKYGKDETNLEKLNEIRRIIVEPLIDLKEKIKRNKDATSITKTIYDFLEGNNVKEKLNEKIKYLNKINEKELAKEYVSSYEALIRVFDEIVLVFKNQNMSFENYRKILKKGLEEESIGTIPQGMDEVIFGDIERSRTHKINTIFILGINDGVFPRINKDEGFLNDNDRSYLKENGIELANGTMENIYEDWFNIYKALSTARENIYLSYVGSSSDGNSKRPSILISKIKKIFPKLKEESKQDVIITNEKATFGDLLVNLRKEKNGEEIEDIWDDLYRWYEKKPEWKLKIDMAAKAYKNINKSEKLSRENIKKLYGDNLKTSVSRLEQYKRCPFSFYLKYGLKLKEEEIYSIKSIDTGSFMHDVIDTFFGRVKNIKELELDDILNIVDEIIDEKLNLNSNSKFLSSSKFIVLTNRLKKVIYESITYIVEQIKNSSFTQEGHEVEFKRTIDNVQITGKIDRIDSVNTKEGKYIRIIDYKSSQKDINLNELLSGTQIQLITYIDSVTDDKNTLPAGMLYFNLIDPIIKSNKNLSDEEIKNEIKKRFKMNGMILADVNIIKQMDNLLESGYSKSIPVYLNKEGKISNSNSNTITKEEFSRLEKLSRRIIKKIADEILEGNIEIKPAYNKKTKTNSCKYCEYKSICKFNPKTNKYSYIDNKSKQQILDEINENTIKE